LIPYLNSIHSQSPSSLSITTTRTHHIIKNNDADNHQIKNYDSMRAFLNRFWTLIDVGLYLGQSPSLTTPFRNEQFKLGEYVKRINPMKTNQMLMNKEFIEFRHWRNVTNWKWYQLIDGPSNHSHEAEGTHLCRHNNQHKRHCVLPLVSGIWRGIYAYD